MKQNPTAGHWQSEQVRRCGCDWPFDWLADVTTFDPARGNYTYVATIRQSGARPLPEAAANVRAMGEAAAMARVIHAMLGVIDMSDPDHPTFADSAADCLDALLIHAGEIRRIATVLGRSSAPPALQPDRRHTCPHS